MMLISKAAQGLLSLLDIKSDGLNPAGFSESLVGVVDVAEFYTAGVQVTSVTPGTVTANGDAITINIPQGELWRLRIAAFSLTVPAATAAVDGTGGALYFDPGTGGAILCSGQTQPKVTAANAWTLTATSNFARPILCGPGGKILFVNDRTMAGAANVNIRLLYDKLGYP